MYPLHSIPPKVSYYDARTPTDTHERLIISSSHYLGDNGDCVTHTHTHLALLVFLFLAPLVAQGVVLIYNRAAGISLIRIMSLLMLLFPRLCPALVKSPCKKEDGCGPADNDAGLHTWLNFAILGERKRKKKSLRSWNNIAFSYSLFYYYHF